MNHSTLTGIDAQAPIQRLSPGELNALDSIAQKDPAFATYYRQYFENQLNGNGATETQDDPWQAFTLANAYEERPPLVHLVGKLFELPSLNIVYGAPGTLKSFLLQDLSVCVAAGLDWLTRAPWQGGGRGISTQQAPVMWLDFDNGARRTHNRFEALGRARDLSPQTPIIYYTMPTPWLYATRPESIGELSARIKAQDARLVIIDNLGNVSMEADENSGEMAGVMAHFRQLAEETGAAIVLIHHQRKGNGAGGRVGDTLRGHSSIEAALDLALLVEREPYSDSITIKATKVRGADVLPFSAAFTFENKPGLVELHTARFYGLEIEDTNSAAAIEREILAALEDAPLNKSHLTKKVKEGLPDVGINRIRDVVDRLASEKRLSTFGGKKTNEVLYAKAG